MTASWKGRGSIVASSWPFLIIWPSWNGTLVSTPETCGTMVTVAPGVTVPSAST